MLICVAMWLLWYQNLLPLWLVILMTIFKVINLIGDIIKCIKKVKKIKNNACN